MKQRFWMLPLVAGFACSAVEAAELRNEVAAFLAVAPNRIGERVTLDHCHLVFTTVEEMTCVGLAADADTGGLRTSGRVLIHVAAAEIRSRSRALASCDGGDLGEGCDVSVSGEIFDASRSFGLDPASAMGLREATIRWPD